MASLEKKMFIIPSRLYTIRDLLFISFNLWNIPRDMKITSMNLHLPLIISRESTNVYIKDIVTVWSEEGLKKGKLPKLSKLKRTVTAKPRQRELIINVSSYINKWNLGGHQNNGIMIKLSNKKTKYLEGNLPFMILDTI